jgi:XTP/dITP diphosphohydrolase
MAVVLATRNAHKLREFQRLLPEARLEPLPDSVELPPETGATFEENALIKARAAAAATNRPAIADDSGIEAEALEGRPGVRSARYAGDTATDAENLDKLRAEVPPGSGLRYVCAGAYVEPGAQPRTTEGTCAGRMAPEPRGERGFGYDPVFVPDGEERTVAELGDDWKAGRSHRAAAAAALRKAVGLSDRSPRSAPGPRRRAR